MAISEATQSAPLYTPHHHRPSALVLSDLKLNVNDD
jgi:hypothetical protein